VNKKIRANKATNIYLTNEKDFNKYKDKYNKNSVVLRVISYTKDKKEQKINFPIIATISQKKKIVQKITIKNID
jgi:hypothetical protein